ncbi:MAG: rhodanese-like domain-containing protein [Aureispira sp.]
MQFSFKILLLFLFIILLVLGVGFGARWYKALTAATYKDLLTALYEDSVPRLHVHEIDALDEFVILDTRLPSEYEVSHLQGALLVNYQAPDWQAVEGINKEQKILVYCSIGYRSERVGEELLERGFKQVYNLHGGIFEWVNEGQLVVDNQGQTVQAIHGYGPRWGKWIKAPLKVVYD